MIIDEIIKGFKSKGVSLNYGASIEDIDKLEVHLGFKFTDPFREFYSKVDGFKDRDWTEGMFSVFSLERIKEEYDYEMEKNGSNSFMPFCDYLINSHCVGFIKGKSGIYKSYVGLKDYHLPEKICDTIKEALKLIHDDSEELL